MLKKLVLIILIGLNLVLMGCGQKGPLYIPVPIEKKS